MDLHKLRYLTKLHFTFNNDVSVAGWLMKVDTKTVEMHITETLSKLGKLVFQIS